MSQQCPPAHAKGYFSEDTIAALITAQGGPVCAIRLSGPLVVQICNQIFKKKLAPVPHKIELIAAYDFKGEPLDQILWAFFQTPKSFTGEDIAEFYLHGSPWIVDQFLRSLFFFGARLALPGEFSFRAVRNGKLSLMQAVAVSDLISSTNGAASTLAFEKLSGSQNDLITILADSLRSLCALSEVGIDFNDQDLEEVSLRTLKSKIPEILRRLEVLEQSFGRGRKIQEGIRVSLLGIPNAGKSSFFNALLGQDRSIVTAVPGTTRDMVSERFVLRSALGSFTLILEDTAGLRASTDLVEKEGIARSRETAIDSDILLFLVDPSQSSEASLEEWHTIGAPSAKTIGVWTKTDLLSTSHQEQNQKLKNFENSLGIPEWVRTSSLTEMGFDSFFNHLAKACLNLTKRGTNEVLLTRFEHWQAVSETITHLRRSSETTEVDLFASDLRQALFSLSPLIGETLPDDILGKIFSNFCIGK